MKRKLILIMVAIVTAVFLGVALTACNRGGAGKSNGNISRQTDAYYVGESETFAVSVEFGKREKVFIADGKATDVQSFVQITVVPLVQNDFESVAFVIAGNSSTLSGNVDKSEYGEFSTAIMLDFAPVSVTVTAGETTSEIQLVNILEGALSAADIVNIAKDEFKERIEKEAAEGKVEREIYIKLISGDRETYYYYISFIGEGVDYWAMLIEPKTGNVVSKK